MVVEIHMRELGRLPAEAVVEAQVKNSQPNH